jgi:hypothetical protein
LTAGRQTTRSPAKAAYVTGQVLTLDGGLTAGWPPFPDA